MNENIIFLVAVAVAVMFMAKRQEGVLEEIVVTSTRRPTNTGPQLVRTNDFEGPFAPGKAPSELGLNGVGDE